MRDIRMLLHMYRNNYVSGEVRSDDYDRKLRNDQVRKNRHLLFDSLLNEFNGSFNSDQKAMVRYLIDDFSSDFKELNRRATDETIILAFMFYLKKLENPGRRLEDYAITKEYGLTHDVFEIILCRMLLKFMERCPIVPRKDYSKDEHEILLREGKR